MSSWFVFWGMVKEIQGIFYFLFFVMCYVGMCFVGLMVDGCFGMGKVIIVEGGVKVVCVIVDLV